MKPINSESVRGLWGACATDDLENFKTEGLRGELLVLRKNAKERIALLDEAAGRLPPAVDGVGTYLLLHDEQLKADVDGTTDRASLQAILDRVDLELMLIDRLFNADEIDSLMGDELLSEDDDEDLSNFVFPVKSGDRPTLANRQLPLARQASSTHGTLATPGRPAYTPIERHSSHTPSAPRGRKEAALARIIANNFVIPPDVRIRFKMRPPPAAQHY